MFCLKTCRKLRYRGSVSGTMYRLSHLEQAVFLRYISADILGKKYYSRGMYDQNPMGGRTMIRIITDSTSDLSKELLERYRVNVLPLHVSLGEAEYRDGVDIAPDQLYAWSDANKTTPKTSAPSLEDAVELFRPILQAGDEIIAFTISSSMSTSFNCMRLAAEELEASDRITVVDSASLSTGIGLLVLEAAQMAEKGFSRQQIAEEMERLKPLVRASFVVDTLTYLYRGGRCSGVAALAGGVLKLHPCIRVENGAMVVVKRYRSKYDKIVLD